MVSNVSETTIDPGGHFVWNLGGGKEVHAMVDGMIAKSRTSSWFKADAEILRRHVAPLRGAFGS